MAMKAPAEQATAGQAADQAVTVMLTEYERLKAEQQARIGFRDNLLYASLAASAAVIAAVASARILALLLVLPIASVVLGWTYLANDHAISAIGRYLRDQLDARLAALVDQPGPLLGWESVHRADRRRRSRKVLQLAVDLIAFTAVPMAAIVTVNAVGPRLVVVVIVSLAETAMVALLACQMVAYGDLQRPCTG
jgi:hypothetical protein